MALVLRNAALQKHVSLLKCMKTRTVVTTTNKNNNQAPLSAAISNTNSWQPGLSLTSSVKTFLRKAEQAAFPVFKSSSTTALEKSPRKSRVINHNTWVKSQSQIELRPRGLSNLTAVTEKKAEPNEPQIRAKPSRSESAVSDACCAPMLEGLASAACPCPCSCACPCPSGPCGCGQCFGNMTDCNCARLLPPPCNTPPRCIQYMQGYYYYPYGTWFCGPYHVCTGGVPFPGPVCPGTACCMAPPDPSLLGRVLGCTMCPTTPGASHKTYSTLANPCPTCLPQPTQQGQNDIMPPGDIFGIPPQAKQTPDTNNNSPSGQKPQTQVNSQADTKACPINPKWFADHAPCQCATCLASRATSFLTKPKESQINSQAEGKLWLGINSDLIQRSLTKKNPKKPAQKVERPNYCEMLKPKRQP